MATGVKEVLTPPMPMLEIVGDQTKIVTQAGYRLVIITATAAAAGTARVQGYIF